MLNLRYLAGFKILFCQIQSENGERKVVFESFLMSKKKPLK